MSAVEVAVLSRDEARSLTDEVRNDAERLWRKLVELYEGKAHVALGYGSWGDYFKAEFGGSRTQAYRLLDAGRVVNALEASTIPDPGLLPEQASELAPLLGSGAARVREAWAEVNDRAAREERPVTAALVREVVRDESRPALHTAHWGDASSVPARPRQDLKGAARNVIAQAVREGRGYMVPIAAMEALMRAVGERA